MTVNKKRRFALVVLCTLVVLSFALSLSASADTIMRYKDGYFRLDLTNTPHISGASIKNALGVPYAIYNNIVPSGNHSEAREYKGISLYTVYIKYNATAGSTSYDTYTFAPVTVSSYMAVPEQYTDENGNTIYRTPLAVLLADTVWWNFKFDGAYTHSRFAVSIDNNANLVVLINPAFYASYDIFLGAYNNQDDRKPQNFIGWLSCYAENPLINNNTSYDKGYSDGYSVGQEDGRNTAVSPIGILFSGVNSVLDIKLFGDVTLGLIVYSALGLGALFIVMKMFNK